MFFKSSFCYPYDITTNVYFTYQSVEVIKVIWNRRYVHKKKIATLYLNKIAFLKSSTLKYWQEFSKFDSLAVSLSLSTWPFSRKVLFLVKVLNWVVLPWIVEWRSLSFSAEKGKKFLEHAKQYHTVLSLIKNYYIII